MPSLIDFRRRIRAVKSTQQITKAMKMVAASRFRRAQERILGARPFQRQMMHVLHNLATRVDEDRHPLFATRDLDKPGTKVLLILVTADKGLCGGFNTNLLKMASQHVLAHPHRNYTFALVGRKGRDYVRRRGLPVHFELVNIFNDVKFIHAQEIARGRHGGVHVGRGRRRRAGLQRVQVGDAAAARRRAGAADPAAAARRDAPTPGSTTSTSRTPRRSSTSCCRATWPSTSSTRCWNRSRPSTARA